MVEFPAVGEGRISSSGDIKQIKGACISSGKTWCMVLPSVNR